MSVVMHHFNHLAKFYSDSSVQLQHIANGLQSFDDATQMKQNKQKMH